MILAVRHPRPALPSSVCYGHTDAGLADTVEQALSGLLDVATQLSDYTIVSSPLLRARCVAQALAKVTGQPLVLEEDLMELNFGAWEGLAWSDVPREALDAWADDPVHYRPGGKESPAELFQRVTRFWQARSGLEGDQLWITHAGPLRCLLALSQGRDFADCLSATFDYGSVLVCR